MKKAPFFIIALIVSLFPNGVLAGSDCAVEIPCPVGNRSYHALPPDNWDGKSKLPVLMHFHGWGRQGGLIMKHRRIAGATRKRGILLIAPNGNGRSWNFWQRETEDVPFARQVLADAAKRWPVDKQRIYVSGYSYGSAMAWRYACTEGQTITALLAVSGTLPSQTEQCATPVHIRHVHGIRDTVMGYPFGPGKDITWPVRLWRKQNGCAEKPTSKTIWNAVKILPFVRHLWANCHSGKNVVLDVHERGHFIPRRWIGRQLDELL